MYGVVWPKLEIGFRANFYFQNNHPRVKETTSSLIPLKAGRNISGDCDLDNVFLSEAEVESKAAVISDILYLFGQGNCIFIREKSGDYDF